MKEAWGNAHFFEGEACGGGELVVILECYGNF